MPRETINDRFANLPKLTDNWLAVNLKLQSSMEPAVRKRFMVCTEQISGTFGKSTERCRLNNTKAHFLPEIHQAIVLSGTPTQTVKGIDADCIATGRQEPAPASSFLLDSSCRNSLLPPQDCATGREGNFLRHQGWQTFPPVTQIDVLTRFPQSPQQWDYE